MFFSVSDVVCRRLALMKEPEKYFFCIDSTGGRFKKSVVSGENKEPHKGDL
jgi:hypothetical protein